MVKTIYKVVWKGNYNRINGVFVAETEEMDEMLRVNPTVNFGKIGANNGELMLHPKDFVIDKITDDLKYIQQFSDYSLETGCNLLNMWKTQKIDLMRIHSDEKKNGNLR